MPLDPSIFLQGAQLQQNNAKMAADFADRFAEEMYKRKALEVELKKAGLDLDKLAEGAIVKMEMGQPLDPREQAGLSGYLKLKGMEQTYDPVTKNVVPKYNTSVFGNLQGAGGAQYPSGGFSAPPSFPSDAISIVPPMQMSGEEIIPYNPTNMPSIGYGNVDDVVPPIGANYNEVSQVSPQDRTNKRNGYNISTPKTGNSALDQMIVEKEVTSQIKEGTASERPDAQLKAAGFYNRMNESKKELDKLLGKDPTAGNAKLGAAGMTEAVLSTIPSFGATDKIGRGLVKYAASPEQKSYLGYADEWIRAKLRKESGAVIGDQEMIDEYSTYFPTAQDGPEQIADKAARRRVAEESMRNESAGTYELQYGNQPQAAQPQGGSNPFKDAIKAERERRNQLRAQQ